MNLIDADEIQYRYAANGVKYVTKEDIIRLAKKHGAECIFEYTGSKDGVEWYECSACHTENCDMFAIYCSHCGRKIKAVFE